jgi:hypothetical protein
MKLSAVVLARALAFFDISDLNPRGRLFFPDLVPLIVERFRFSAYPQKPEDFDEKKGVVFSHGYISNNSIDKLTVWNDGLGLDVRSSTDEAKVIIKDTFQWLSEKVGLNYNEDSIRRWGYLNSLTFHSDVDMLRLNPAVERLCKRISSHIEGPRNKKYIFHAANLAMTFDRYMNPWTQAPFSIQRRGDVPYEDNKYFSEAPLPTDVHLELLQAFEDDLKTENTNR